MYLCNKERYGYLNVPAKPHYTLEDDRVNFVHVHLESMSENGLRFSGFDINEDRKTALSDQMVFFFSVSEQLMVLKCKRRATSTCCPNGET